MNNDYNDDDDFNVLCAVQSSKVGDDHQGSQIGDTWCTPFICGSHINLMMMKMMSNDGEEEKSDKFIPLPA